MTTPKPSPESRWVIFLARRLILCLLTGLFPLILFAQSNPAGDISRGRLLFSNHCGRCHGLKGGGGTGPSLQRPTLLRAPDDEALASIIMNGIPGTGMPGSWMLGPEEVTDLIAFVRRLGETATEPITGNATKGKELFIGKGACLTCHIVDGEGNSLGPELTGVGLRRGAGYLRQAIQHPGKEKPVDRRGFATYLVVEVELKDGRRLRGVRINEDTFSIQIRDAANQIHSFRKDALKSLRAQKDESLMPSFRETFTPEEVDHLVAFLASLKNEHEN